MSVVVDDALLAHLVSGSFGLPIAYEGEPYSPPTSGGYLQPFVIPNFQYPITLAGSEQITGIFRVMVRYPAGKGAIEAKAKAEAICNHFRSTSVITRSGQKVIVQYTHRARGYVEDNWFIVPVTVAYKAFITR